MQQENECVLDFDLHFTSRSSSSPSQIAAAYEVLKSNRKQYDNELKGGFGGFEDFFSRTGEDGAGGGGGFGFDFGSFNAGDIFKDAFGGEDPFQNMDKFFDFGEIEGFEWVGEGEGDPFAGEEAGRGMGEGDPFADMMRGFGGGFGGGDDMFGGLGDMFGGGGRRLGIRPWGARNMLIWSI